MNIKETVEFWALLISSQLCYIREQNIWGALFSIIALIILVLSWIRPTLDKVEVEKEEEEK